MNINRKSRIEILENNFSDIFISVEAIMFANIKIFKNSLVIISDGILYINETDLGFVNLLLEVYPDFKNFKIGNDLFIEHPKICNNHNHLNNNIDNGNIKVSNGTTNRWNKNHFCIAGVPTTKDLEDLPTNQYNGIEYSSWGYSIDLKSLKILSGFYKRDGIFYEKTGGGFDDLIVR